MDHKMAAAGDNQESPNALQTSGRVSSLQDKRRELAMQVLEFLVTFTQAKLNPTEVEAWITRLSTVPVWKLMKLADFTSPHIADIWKFFDGLKQEHESFKALPEPNPTSRGIQVARDFADHVDKWCGGVGSKAYETGEERRERRQGEWDSYVTLDKKYPWLNILSQVRNEDRFKEVSK